jgi:hypothetical protein
MKRVRSLRFEALEARQLLSRGHMALAHAAHAALAPAAQVVLDGTLSVNNNPRATSTTMNADGSSTTTVLVSGQLGSLGQVRGTWNESVDAYGNYVGPDTLVLHDARGSILVAFNNENSPRAATRVTGGLTYEHAQRVVAGSRAFARATETGTIVVTTSAAKAEVVSLTFHTTSS